jgi:hypothetical protein
MMGSALWQREARMTPIMLPSVHERTRSTIPTFDHLAGIGSPFFCLGVVVSLSAL